MATRRSLLFYGGAAIVLTGATAASWTLTRTPRKAVEPWDQSAIASIEDPLLRFLSFALLAPNPHNMQPWEVHVVDETRFDLYANLDRLLPETDPLSRQITLGFGCFLEVFRLAALDSGWLTRITPFPDGQTPQGLTRAPIASVRIVEDGQANKDPLFSHVFARRTVRTAFHPNRPISSEDLAAIAAVGMGVGASPATIGFTNSDPHLSDLKALTKGAWEVEWRHPPTRKESVDVTRVGAKELDAQPWGLALQGPMIEALKIVGAMNRDDMNTPGQSAYEESLKFYSNACESAAAFLWLVTTNNDRIAQLEAGYAWVRMHLKAAALGVAFHPLSQALQEFPEMAAHYRRAHTLLAPDGGVVQMLSRLGYGRTPAPAPREHLDAKLIQL